MSQTLELPDALYIALQRIASEQGMTPVAWIATHLDSRSGNEKTNKHQRPRTLTERFAGRTGRIASGGKEGLSEATGMKFAEHLEAKRRKGEL